VSRQRPLRRLGPAILVAFTLAATPASADKLSGRLVLQDALTAPNQAVRVEAQLVQKGLLMEGPLGGEPLQLEVDGKAVATAMTGGDGRAFFDYTPRMRGTNRMTVTLNSSPRVEAAPADAGLFVWERRRPILVVEMAALMPRPEGSGGGVPLFPFGKSEESGPLPDAAEELARLTQYYYNVVYLQLVEQGTAGAVFVEAARRWLSDNKFPAGYVLAVSGGSGGVGALIDRFKQEGWTALRSGVGRSRAFAEAFLERRLEVVLVPEPAKGDIPRKAKVAKDWKGVRKQL
jgi:hypothetical protein